MANVFDKFDTDTSNPFDKFDVVNKPHSTLANATLGLVNGAASIGTTLLRPLDATGLTGMTNLERKASIKQVMNDNADTNSYAFQGSDLAAGIAGTLGIGGGAAKVVSLIPKLAKYAPVIASGGFNLGNAATGSKLANIAIRSGAGGAVGAAGSGLINPDSTLLGAGIGAALPSSVKGLGMVGGKIASSILPNADKLALIKRANDLGIPAGLATGYDSGIMGGMKSVLNDLPFIGRINTNAKNASQEGLNRAVGNTFGADATSLTPEVMSAAKKNMGDEFNRIYSNNDLKITPEFLDNLSKLKSNSNMLMQGEGLRLNNTIDDFMSKSDNGVISGDIANRFQSKINTLSSKANGFLKDDLQSLRGNILEAFNKSVSGSDAAALTKNRMSYKNFKTVEPLLNSAETAVAGRISGDVPISLLPNAVNKSFSNPAGLPLTDISQIGSRLLTDRVKQTGGSAKAMVQNSFIGSGGALAMAHNPIGAIAGLLGAATTQKLLNSPAVAKIITNNKGNPQGLLNMLLPMISKANPALINRDQ